MQLNTPTPFLEAIHQLRSELGLTLTPHLYTPNTEELELVGDFLENEYRSEALNYPYSPPEFDREAAVWGALYVFNSAQLLLVRDHPVDDLSTLLTSRKPENASAALSADLCLRFLPELLLQAEVMDPEDPLIPLLSSTLKNWNFSYIQKGISLDNEAINTDLYLSTPCLRQLYLDRCVGLTIARLSL